MFWFFVLLKYSWQCPWAASEGAVSVHPGFSDWSFIFVFVYVFVFVLVLFWFRGLSEKCFRDFGFQGKTKKFSVQKRLRDSNFEPFCFFCFCPEFPNDLEAPGQNSLNWKRFLRKPKLPKTFFGQPSICFVFWVLFLLFLVN